MTIYAIQKENCQVSKLTGNFSSAQKAKEALYDEVVNHDREPEELIRFENLEESRAEFERIVEPCRVKFGSYNGFTTANFTLYELVEWKVDEDEQIVEGGDVWDWEIGF